MNTSLSMITRDVSRMELRGSPTGPSPTRPTPASLSEWEEERPDVPGARLISLFTPAPGLVAADLLRQARGQERFYWAAPDDLELVGVGVAAEIISAPFLGTDAPARFPAQRFDEIESQARQLFDRAIFQPMVPAGTGVEESDLVSLARPRLFGGFSFQDDFVPDNTWSTYRPAEFILPHYQFARRGEAAYLTIHALVGTDEDLAESIQGLREALLARLHQTTPGKSLYPTRTAALSYPMTPSNWRDMVAGATQAIGNGQLQKVVLARVCEVEMTDAIDAVAALAYLGATYGECYRFLFEPRPYHAFFGATPELLVCKRDDAFATMALAGSIARDADGQDEALAAQLLSSAKDRHEHQLVIDAIRDSLAGWTSELHIAPEPEVLRLPNIQHLHTPITGRLATPGPGILGLVCRLHPTPAIGGVPSDKALAFLKHVEPVPRGWYAAPIGWIDSAFDGAFAVAIRSAVTQYDRAWLYAGAGIVDGSDPEREWAETALKFRPMLGALGVDTWSEKARE